MNEEFFSMCGNRFGEYGYVSGSTERLTEETLIKNGVYGQKLHVIYDLSVKPAGSEKFHTVSVESEILIPVSSIEEDTEEVTSEETVEYEEDLFRRLFSIE